MCDSVHQFWCYCIMAGLWLVFDRCMIWLVHGCFIASSCCFMAGSWLCYGWVVVGWQVCTHCCAGMTARQEQALANLVRVQALVSEHIRCVTACGSLSACVLSHRSSSCRSSSCQSSSCRWSSAHQCPPPPSKLEEEATIQFLYAASRGSTRRVRQVRTRQVCSNAGMTV